MKFKFRFFYSLAASTAAIVILASSVCAEPIVDTPEFLELSTPEYHPYEADFEPNLGLYTYEVSWNGIPAAEATVNVASDGDRYHIVAGARLYSPINVLYSLKYRAEGLITVNDLMPVHSVIDIKESSRVKSTSLDFDANGHIESVRKEEGQPTHVMNFTADNLTLDPFSASFIARGLDWKVGETKYFDTFNGKTRYLISLTAEGKETVKVNGQERLCWVIVPTVQKLNAHVDQHKLRKAKIYMTDDRSRELVKVVSEVFIGAVTTKLVSYQPAQSSAPLRMAQVRARAILK